MKFYSNVQCILYIESKIRPGEVSRDNYRQCDIGKAFDYEKNLYGMSIFYRRENNPSKVLSFSTKIQIVCD